jgi:biotin-[acetyl-CoA-carboxylase] ligase BirA-like protein
MPADAMIARETLNIDVIRQQLATHTIWRRIVLHEVVASTNASLRELADAGALEGTVVLAESQTAGRGRGHKTWFSPPGVNLYASILFRPPIAAVAAPGFAFIAPLALVDSIREVGGKAGLKWPNDVLVRNRKVAGVRAEMTARGDSVDYIVLGVGVNLNVTHEALRTGLGETGRFATSLREALGRAVDRNAFTARFLTCWRVPGYLSGEGRSGNPGSVARPRRGDGTASRSPRRADGLHRPRPRRRHRGAPPGQGHPQACPHGRRWRDSPRPASVIRGSPVRRLRCLTR